jgi:hypothetical protein
MCGRQATSTDNGKLSRTTGMGAHCIRCPSQWSPAGSLMPGSGGLVLSFALFLLALPCQSRESPHRPSHCPPGLGLRGSVCQPTGTCLHCHDTAQCLRVSCRGTSRNRQTRTTSSDSNPGVLRSRVGADGPGHQQHCGLADIPTPAQVARCRQRIVVLLYKLPAHGISYLCNLPGFGSQQLCYYYYYLGTRNAYCSTPSQALSALECLPRYVLVTDGVSGPELIVWSPLFLSVRFSLHLPLCSRKARLYASVGG